MTKEKFQQKLEEEKKNLEQIKDYSFSSEIDKEVEAYRLQVEQKYADIKNAKIVKAETRISLLEELMEEESTEQEVIDSMQATISSIPTMEVKTVV